MTTITPPPQSTLKSVTTSLGPSASNDLEKFLSKTVAEIEDVYRGCCTVKPSPAWPRCKEGTCPSLPKKEAEEKTEEGSTEENSSKSSCTRKRKNPANQSKSRKKRATVVEKDESSECLYNPHCLISLGGVLNDVQPQHEQRNKDSNAEKSSDELSLRESITITPETIHRYLSSFSLPPTFSADEYLQHLYSHHSNLLLSPSSQHQISLPPGIKNLGATCYLNSQLQVLAQNPTFLNGILSYTPKQTNMKQVLQNLQYLLARMAIGGHGTLSASDFAQSLGLLENEMQDPNEFGRLLFDRMHESFQADENLKELLPELFRGVTSYSTKCNTCNSVSRREEEFMDLTLNISKGNNLDVFLQEYLTPEELSEDNQYYCAKCSAKQDAIRSTSFSHLPPVLNIQLARYVFYIKMGMKRKIMEEVLLPKTLKIPCQGLKEYVLCGVLHHLGSSAYGGHYMASAMDWRSGMWFQFNDEEVSYLEEGLDCVYDPQKKNKGSADAYNMYYVEKDYLSSFIAKDDITQKKEGVLSRVQKERLHHYKLVQGIQLQNQAKMEMLQRRRDNILSHFSPSLSSINYTTIFMWVDGPPLQHFLACKDLEVPSSNIFCPHSKIDPRVARRGKLLPRPAFDIYSSILKEENPDVTLYSCISSSLFCQECASSYKAKLQIKFSSFVTLLELVHELDPKRKETQDPKRKETEGEFFIGKKFATDLRRYGINKIKEALIEQKGLDTLNLNYNEEEELDPEVNSKITCTHKNCAQKKQTARIVSASTWKKIVSLFPLAIEHFRSNGNCNICKEQSNNQSLIPEKLHLWANNALQDPFAHSLYSRQTNHPLEYENELYLVESGIVKRWKRTIWDHSKKKKTATLVLMEFSKQFQKKKVEEEEEEEKNCGIFCEKHGLTLPLPLQMQQFLLSGEVTEDGGALTSLSASPGQNEVEILTQGQYQCLSLSLRALAEVFCPSNEPTNNPTILTWDVKDPLQEEGKVVPAAKITLSEAGDRQYSVIPPICTEPSCHQQPPPEVSKPVQDDRKSITLPIHEVGWSVELSSLSSTPSITPDDPNLRRSTRKRKTRPMGNERRYSITLQQNDTLAKLRLLLLEQRGKTPLHQELFLNKTKDPSLVELEVKWNDRIMNDIFTELDCRLEDIVCIYLRNKEGENKGVKTKENQLLESSMIDSLMEMAAGDKVSEGASSRNAKGRRIAERGFRGTLLQSATSSEAGNENDVVEVMVLNGEVKGETKNDLKGGDVDNPFIVDDSENGQDATVDENIRDTACVEGEMKEADAMDMSKLNDPIFSPGSQCVDVSLFNEDCRQPMANECSVQFDDVNDSSSEVVGTNISMYQSQELSSIQDIPIVAQQPSSKNDLSPSAILFTSPIYHMNNKTSSMSSSPTQEDNDHIVPLIDKNCKLELLDAEQVCIFINEARHMNQKMYPNQEALSKLFEQIPEYVPPDHTRHLYRNFIDSVDPILPPAKTYEVPPIHLCISRREMDIMLYFASVGKSPKDFHHLMPYRNLNGLRWAYSAVKSMKYHEKNNEYMANVSRCVETIIRLEEDEGCKKDKSQKASEDTKMLKVTIPSSQYKKGQSEKYFEEKGVFDQTLVNSQIPEETMLERLMKTLANMDDTNGIIVNKYKCQDAIEQAHRMWQCEGKGKIHDRLSKENYVFDTALSLVLSGFQDRMNIVTRGKKGLPDQTLANSQNIFRRNNMDENSGKDEDTGMQKVTIPSSQYKKGQSEKDIEDEGDFDRTFVNSQFPEETMLERLMKTLANMDDTDGIIVNKSKCQDAIEHANSLCQCEEKVKSLDRLSQENYIFDAALSLVLSDFQERMNIMTRSKKRKPDQTLANSQNNFRRNSI